MVQISGFTEISGEIFSRSLVHFSKRSVLIRVKENGELIGRFGFCERIYVNEHSQLKIELANVVMLDSNRRWFPDRKFETSRTMDIAGIQVRLNDLTGSVTISQNGLEIVFFVPKGTIQPR